MPVSERCDECGKFHLVQTNVGHDLHIRFKEAAAASRFGNMQAVIQWLITRFLEDEVDNVLLEPAAAPRVSVRLSQLVGGTVDEVMDFAMLHNLVEVNKRDVIRHVVESDRFIVPDMDPDNLGYQCGYEDCGAYGHNTRTCEKLDEDTLP